MAKNNGNSSLGMNAIYKMILNVFNLLVPLFVGPYIAGLLDKDLYGMYNRVYAEFQVFFILGAFGIYNYGVRELSKVRGNTKKTQEIFQRKKKKKSSVLMWKSFLRKKKQQLM